jgi:hypothetical protein
MDPELCLDKAALLPKAHSLDPSGLICDLLPSASETASRQSQITLLLVLGFECEIYDEDLEPKRVENLLHHIIQVLAQCVNHFLSGALIGQSTVPGGRAFNSI